ncbi:hypothetical protein AALA98_11000 [Lachnospiraceae bacterium 45-W7]
MKKSEFWKKSYIDERDEQEKETFLRELGNSVHNYIKTGVKNRQLEDLIELEAEFNQKYEERFDTKKIAEQISEFSKESLIGIVEKYKEKMERAAISEGNAEDRAYSVDTIYRMQLGEASDEIYEIVVEKMSDNLNTVIRDMAYLSHMNMLYELYEREEQLRREEEEYDRISQKYQKIADIMKNLSQKRRMQLEQLQEQTDISQKELEKILNRNSKYFNMRQKLESIQISLSPSGKKFYEHIMDSQEKFSREAANQLIYKNCDRLMEALENSYVGGLEYELKLESLSSDRERALQSKYHEITQRFISDNEDMYMPLKYAMRKEKERVYKNNEKNRITIPREWDYEVR